MCVIPSNVYTVSPGAIHTEITEAAAPVEIGQSYSLLCRVLKNVSGLTETPTAQWFDSKGLITERSGAVSTGGQSILTFSPLKTSHAGSYRCEGSVTSPALKQPLVTNSTWELNVKSRSLIISMLLVTLMCFAGIVPTPTITLTRRNDGSKLNAGDSETFTCRVAIPRGVDTSVNVSLTWVREFLRQQPEYLTTEYIFVDSSQESTTFTVVREITVVNLTSMDQRVSCRSVVHPLSERYILSSEENSQSLMLEIEGMHDLNSATQCLAFWYAYILINTYCNVLITIGG